MAVIFILKHKITCGIPRILVFFHSSLKWTSPVIFEEITNTHDIVYDPISKAFISRLRYWIVFLRHHAIETSIGSLPCCFSEQNSVFNCFKIPGVNDLWIFLLRHKLINWCNLSGRCVNWDDIFLHQIGLRENRWQLVEYTCGSISMHCELLRHFYQSLHYKLIL